MEEEVKKILEKVLDRLAQCEDEDCVWMGLGSRDWVTLLTKFQASAAVIKRIEQKCDEVDGWSKIGSNSLVTLLSHRFDLVDKPFQPLAWENIPKYQKPTKDVFVGRKEGNGWLRLLRKHPELATYFDKYGSWRTVDGNDWLSLLLEQPQLSDKCDQYDGWKKLSKWAWLTLLEKRPKLASKCDKCDGWNLLSGHDWMLLEKRPEFAPNCDKCNGWNSLSGDEWVELLKSQPQFADRCDRYNGWIKFSKLQWVSMQQLISSQLENQHQLSRNSEAEKRWMELNGHDWVQLLQRKPAFITKCGEYGGWDKISECKGWFELLKARSELFIEQCDHHNGWARLNAHQWVSLLKDHVKLSGKCDAANGWRTFTGFDWVVLLREQPFFLTKCQEWGGWASITECKCWCELLEVCPQFANKCDESRGWNTFDGFDWWRLLKAQTFFIEKCNEFNGWRQVYSCAFEAYGKQEAACSQIADYDWVFDSRHYDDFGYLRNPFLGICGKVGICGNDENLLKRVDSSFWIYTLKTNFASINSGYTSSPRMSIYDYRHFSDLGIWWRFTRDDWEQLACAYNGDVLNSIAPFVDERFWNALLKCWPTWFDDAQDEQKVHHWPIWDGYSQKVQAARCCMSRFSAWPYLLVYHPEYADACKDQNGWRSFEKNDWQRLIDSNFLGKVDRNALDAGFWFALLSKAPQFSKTCDEYNGWVALAPDNWFKLLIANSNFADRCNVWFQFDGEQWVELLKQNASFSGACDQSEGWTKFGKKDWLSLLLANRTFASKCEETGAAAKFGWNSIDEAIDDELERQRHRYDYLDDVLEPSPDWREESGWNDMYGDADPSDFIEFR